MSHRFFGVLSVALAAPLGALSCSDPVPQSAAVGLSLNVAACPVTRPQWSLGNPAPNSSLSQFGTPIFSGEGGTKVSCRVTADGQITADITGPGGLGFRVADGRVNVQNGSGTATISLLAGTQSWMKQPTNTTDQPCTLQVIRTTKGYKVEAGALWASFQCFNMKSPGGAPPCSSTGELVLERCDD